MPPETRSFQVLDSGNRTEYATGARRDRRSGKGHYDSLPPLAIHRLAQHHEAGNQKYGRDNWRKGIPIREYLQSALRHLFCYLSGKREEDHLIAVAWNVLCAVETQEMISAGILSPDLDDVKYYTENWTP